MYALGWPSQTINFLSRTELGQGQLGLVTYSGQIGAGLKKLKLYNTAIQQSNNNSTFFFFQFNNLIITLYCFVFVFLADDDLNLFGVKRTWGHVGYLLSLQM